jgi:phosphatidate cytidylyltransferase
MTELAKRVMVAAVGAPAIIAVIWFGDAALATFVATASAIAAWEFFRLVSARGGAPLAPLGVLAAAVVPLLAHAQQLGFIRVPLSTLVLPALLVCTVVLFRRPSSARPMEAAAVTLFGVVYTGGALSFLYVLRNFEYVIGQAAGTLVVLFPVALTWATDIGAFFVGRAVGGAKLMPSVSPGKTVSGAIGGVVFAVLMAWVFQRYALIPHAQIAFSPWALVGVAIAVSVAGQLGDLVESHFKREAGVKDSSQLLPGHGGVLDRVDSLLFTLPIGYLLLRWLVIPIPR